MRKALLLVSLFQLTFSWTALAQPTGTLTAIHGIPGDSVDASLPRELPVDVYVNEDYAQPAFSFDFGQSVDNLELPVGNYLIEVFLMGVDPNGNDPVLSAEVAIGANQNFTAVAHLTYTGDPDAPGIALSAFKNETSFLPSPQARLTVRHTANAPVVAVETRRFLFWPYVTFPGFSNNDGEGPEERVFDFLRGPLFVNLLAGGNQVFTTGRLNFPNGQNIVAYAIGDFFTDSFQLFLQVIE